MNDLIRPDHGCFGCGAANPSGLHLVFESRANGGVVARFTPRIQDEGFAGMVHGGIIATLLDEAMAWAISSNGIWAVTARMEVRFRKPVPSGVELTLTGQMTANHGRKVDATALIHDSESGDLLAESSGVFMRVPDEQARAWQSRYIRDEIPGDQRG